MCCLSDSELTVAWFGIDNTSLDKVYTPTFQAIVLGNRYVSTSTTLKVQLLSLFSHLLVVRYEQSVSMGSERAGHWSLKAEGCIEKPLNGRLHAKERS